MDFCVIVSLNLNWSVKTGLQLLYTRGHAIFPESLYGFLSRYVSSKQLTSLFEFHCESLLQIHLTLSIQTLSRGI